MRKNKLPNIKELTLLFTLNSKSSKNYTLMKDYYFMRKPEAVDAEDYEKEGGYTRYYAKRKEWQAERPKRNQGYKIPDRFKKQRKFFYLFNALFIIAIFIVWKSKDIKEKDPTTFYSKEEKLLYFMRSGKDAASGRKLLLVYIRNAEDQNLQIDKSFNISFFYRIKEKDKKGQNFLIKEASQNINKMLLPRESLSIGECIIKEDIEGGAVALGAVINDNIVLLEELAHTKE